MLKCHPGLPFFILFILLTFSAFAEPKTGEKPPTPAKPPNQKEVKTTDFIRFIEEDEADSLQTALVTFRSPEGASVDLIGAVHVADKTYFEALNTRFKTYEAVLYELVGRPIEQRDQLQVADGSEKLQWLGALQEKMRSTLQLESQLQCIHYKAPNFVHADLSVDGFFKAQDEKKENFLTLWMKASLAQATTGSSEQASDLEIILTLLMSKDSPSDLKRLIGREFDRVEKLMTGIEAGNGTAIIGERNRHALEVLQKQIRAGKKKLAIFYGAAHLPDMEERLLKQGYQKQSTTWLKAWNMPN